MFERLIRMLEGLRLKHGEAGQTMVEYGLIIALIAVAAIFGVSLVSGGVDSLWGWIGGDVGNAVDSVIE